MKLLFLTRKVDSQDERVGFATDWILEFAKNLDVLIIICQEKGDISNLPQNVFVHSLGKEKGYGKLRQFLNFRFYILKNIKAVDGVFSHMVAQLGVFAGPACKRYKKKLIQWYVHKSVTPWLKLSRLFVDEYVSVNKQSFRMKTKKPVNFLGHGINISKFKTKNSNLKDKFKILSIGRISPVKNLDVIISAIEKINLNFPELRDKILVQIIGAPGLISQQKYYLELIKDVKEKKLNSLIDFLGPLPHAEVVNYYQNCDLFINLSETGSVDKAVLEAMASEKLVLTSNEAFKNILPQKLYLEKNDSDLLVKKIKEIFNLKADEKDKLVKNLRQEVEKNHNLSNLVHKIIDLYKK